MSISPIIKRSFGSFELAIQSVPGGFTVKDARGLLLQGSLPGQAVRLLTDTPALVRLALDSGAELMFSLRPDGFDISGIAADALRFTFQLLGRWYGMGQLIHQAWPLERIMLHESELLTADNGHTGLNCILSPVWMNSLGAAILGRVPLSVALNQPPPDEYRYPRYAHSLGAEKGPFAHRPFVGDEGDGLLTLSCQAGSDPTVPLLSLYFAQDVVAAYQRLGVELGHPRQTPPEAAFRLPTWTTWARYKTAVSQSTVLRFAQEIREHDFPYGVLEIDDRWQVHYGDLSFDPQRFPAPRQMIDALHAQGFKVTAWVIPFLSPESQAFQEGARRGWLVREPGGGPYLVRWWQGMGGLLDVTNPAALEWFFGRLRALQDETGLDGYKFDAGEGLFLPIDGLTQRPIHRNDYSHYYVEAVAAHYSLTEVRCGWFNQAAPIFFRQWDKSSTWGLDNGLRSVLTGILSLGMAGYPFVLPDMIGGNEYEEKANAELLIRWTQLNALLPAMQFGLAPWDYGAECSELCRKAAQLHLAYAGRILAAAAEATVSGRPVICPLFWAAPTDEQALVCDDEFLLGDDILVAPVLQEGQRARDIYLPAGNWRCVHTGEYYQGPLSLRNFPAPLDVLPVFRRES